VSRRRRLIYPWRVPESPYRRPHARDEDPREPRVRVARVAYRLGALYEALGRDGDAIVLYERALGLIEGTETGVEARVLDGLGAVYARAGRQADADRALHRAEAIRKIIAVHGAG
jgi:tetratricopeptide (TPR) repeat protein